MQIGKPQTNAASDHQIRTVAMQLAAGNAEAGSSVSGIIEDAKAIAMFIKFGTAPAENPHK